MSKILSTLVFLGISATAFAQPVLKIGGEVGGTFGTMSQKFYGETRETQFQAGFKIGAVLDIGFNDHFSLQPGLFLTTNGGSESNHDKYFSTGAGLPTSDHDNRRYHVTWLQLPVYALYKTGDEYSDRFFAGFGPYIGMAIGGKFEQEYTNTLNGQDITKRPNSNLRIGYEPKDQMGRYDLGLQATAGYETLFGLYFRVFYGYGLLNVAPNPDSENAFHNSVGGITIGFLFKPGSNRGY
jgi:hypothetical protein